MYSRKWILLVLVILALLLHIPGALSSELLPPNITLSDKTAVYTGQAISIGLATVTGVEGQGAPTGEVTYAYYTDSGCSEPFSGTPKNAGTYYAIAFLASDGVYNAAQSGAATLTITPAAPTLVFENKTVTYAGEGIPMDPPTALGVSETDVPTGALTYAYYTNSDCIQLYSGTPRNAGIYYAKAILAADNNFTPQSKVAVLTINKKLLTGFVYGIDGTGKVYDGTTAYDRSISISFRTDDGRISSDNIYSSFGVQGSTEFVNAAVGFQDVMITASLSDSYPGSNYTFEGGSNQMSQLCFVKIEIRPATPTILLADRTVAYTGLAAAIGPATVQGVSSTDVPVGSLTYTYYTDDACTDALPGAPTNAGTYYAKAVIAAGGNYTAAQSNVATLTITPAVPTITLSNKAVTYTGLAVSAPHAQVRGVSEADVPGGELTYAYYTEAACLDALPGAPTNAGTYYVKAFISAHGNYAARESGVATLTIFMVEPTLVFENKTVPYAGVPIEIDPLVVLGVSETDIPTGSLTFGYFTDSGCTQPFSGIPKNAGTYYAKADLAQDNNYIAQSKVVTLTITKKILTGFSPAYYSGGKVYDGTTTYDKYVTVWFFPEDGLVNGEQFGIWQDVYGTMEYASPNAGEDGILITAHLVDTEKTRNYTFATGNQFTKLVHNGVFIRPATPTITLNSKTLSYTGAAASMGPAVVHGIHDTDVPTGAVSYTYYTDEACLNVLPGAPKNAGTYYAKATIAQHGNYTAATSSAARLVITPAAPTLTLLDKTVAAYTGTQVAIGPATVQGTSVSDTPTGAVTYTYYTNSGCTQALPDAPVNAGTYYVRAAIAPENNYAGALSNVATLTIPKKITLIGYSIDGLQDKVYDGSDAAPGSGESVFHGLIGSETLLAGTDYLFTLHFESKDAGLHSIFLKNTLCNTVNANNYIFAQGNSLSLNTFLKYRITPANVTIVVRDSTTTYWGEPVGGGTIFIDGLVDGEFHWKDLKLFYYFDAACTELMEGKPTYPGTYYQRVGYAPSINYTIGESNTAVLTITPAVPTITLVDSSVVYTGSPAVIGPAVLHGVSDTDTPMGNVTYAYYSDADCLQALPSTPVQAGTYYAKAFIEANGNYDAAQSTAALLTITPAVPGVTLANKSAVYTGAPISIDPAVLTGVLPYDVPAGAVTYTYFTNNTLTRVTSVPRAPGTYYVVASIAAFGNYGAAVSEPAVLSIALPERPLQQVQTKTGHNVTLLTDPDTILHMNWLPVSNLVLDQDQNPGFFSAKISSLEDKTHALTLDLMPDSDKDGNVIHDEAGKPLFGRRTMNLSAKFIKSLLHSGIYMLNINYGQISISISLSDLGSLPDFETADAFRLVIEPVAAETPAEGAAGSLIARDGSGILYRVSVLVVYEKQEQAKPLQLPSLALTVTDQP